jgi:hypothetical protein
MVKRKAKPLTISDILALDNVKSILDMLNTEVSHINELVAVAVVDGELKVFGTLSDTEALGLLVQAQYTIMEGES